MPTSSETTTVSPARAERASQSPSTSTAPMVGATQRPGASRTTVPASPAPAARAHLAAGEAPRGTVEHGHVDVDRTVVNHLVALALEGPAGPAGGDAVAAHACPSHRGAV